MADEAEAEPKTKRQGRRDTLHEKVIAALLTCDNTEAALEKAQVSRTTLHRLQKDPAFVSALRSARRAQVEGAIGSIQRLAEDAVAALRRNLTCGKPAVEVRCALGILQAALQGVETLDLEERLQEIENALAAQKQEKWT